MSEEQQRPTSPKEAFLPASLGEAELSHAMREALFNLKDGLIFQEPVVTRKGFNGRPAEFLRTPRVGKAQEALTITKYHMGCVL